MTICDVNKIDSNVSGLSYAEEACLRQLPSTVAGDNADPIWFGLEPNSYSDFGGDLTTVARQPLSAGRQRKKGTVTDLSASGGFNSDLTQTNLTRLMQGFFFNDASEKPTTQPLNALMKSPTPVTSVATADDSFNAGAGLNIFLPKHLIKASGFAAGNNGLHVVTSAVAAKVVVTSNLTDEAAPGTAAKLEAVGFRFAAGELTLTASAANFLLTVSGLAKSSGTLTTTGNAVANETVTIAGKVYTWKAAPTVTANEVKVGASATASLANLAAAINGAAGAGTLYGSATVPHTLVTATSGASTLVVTAKNGGTAGNAYGTTQTMTNATWGAATLTGGAGSAGWLALGIQVGEWLFIGGDGGEAGNKTYTLVASTNRAGYARVSAVTDQVLTFDDSTFTPQTDAGAGKTIEVYFGTVLKNGTKTRSYQLERSLGSDANGPQTQYVEGAVANELTVNFPSADKLNVDLSFIALNDSTRTGTEGVKPGARVAAPGESAFNTSLDLYRIRMAVIDEAEMNSESLFGYLTEATLTVANNASPAKALGYLGGFDVNVGNFDAGGTLTAYFQTVEAIRAIRNNADISWNFITAAMNAGFVFDMPLLGVGGGRLNIELNSPITIPLTSSAAENPNGYTLLGNWFSYLPDAAMPV